MKYKYGRKQKEVRSHFIFCLDLEFYPTKPFNSNLVIILQTFVLSIHVI